MYAKPTAPRSIGGILDDGIRLYRDSFANSWPLALSAQLVLSIPAAIIQYKLRGIAIAGNSPQAVLSTFASPVVWLPYLVGVIIFFGFYNSVIVQLDGIATTKMVSRGRSLAGGFRLLPRTILLFIVMLLAFLAAVFVGSILAGVLGAMHAPVMLGVVIVALTAIILYVWGRAFLSNIALVVEDAGVFKSLGISWNLIKNNWWRAATVYTMAFILVMALYVMVAAANGALAGASLRTAFGIGTVISQLVSLVGGTVLMSFIPAILLAMYYDLKLRQEGTDLASRVNALAPQ